ncbi:D-2-hydroxyacid dehydrogenase [Kurthia sibirica]|uniref:D-2-hydroxyacid dehydrogenase n=1 Tax=Kurthia sibirica TaxID=202750 RepID=A0A2U3ALA5_9BACL|nr:D-2-hydroxyacid dehydrogenase [Kurthia sibirica]PWI25307.1 D-2-hydroxyacid dehydrogenase [Kurthia sibirica]GEK34629.1 glycerate dehydrogenase [Kurthia sibirica]
MIYFTFDPRPDLKSDLQSSLPNEQLIFAKKIDPSDFAKAEIIVSYGEDLTPENIALAQELKWLFIASAGVEKLPLTELKERGITVSNVRGIHKTPMAESVLGHILAHYRSLPTIYKEQTQHNWRRKMPSKELRGQTALILGPGAIGGEIGRLLQAFGVQTIGCNRSKKHAPFMDRMVGFDDLLTALPTADIVLSVLPSTPQTYHLLTTEYFLAMKEDALFLNFGRGTLVETAVLQQALETHEIAAAVCDVFEEEPLPATSALWQLENLTVSPHTSSHSSRYLERSFELFKRDFINYRAHKINELENLVDLTAGY